VRAIITANGAEAHPVNLAAHPGDDQGLYASARPAASAGSARRLH
jgi:hypothetical protein